MAQNALEIKEKIIGTLKRRGPSLPVHIAKEAGLSILFAGAFLSELVEDKKIRYTDMKVGSSPIYFLAEHAPMLEKFSQYLNSREKDAFNLLREKKFLIDREQSPVIRVALRAIKDFAVPLHKNGQTFWKYYTASASDFNPEVVERVEKMPEIKAIEKAVEKLAEEISENIVEPKPEKSERIKTKEEKKEHHKEIVSAEKTEKPKKTGNKKTTKKKKIKVDDNFFNKVKEWIMSNSMEIIDIKNFNKNELHLKVKRDGKEHLLVAYNKKKITDLDLVKANKKARELGFEYTILSFGELKKKMSDIIDAAKNLSDIKRLE